MAREYDSQLIESVVVRRNRLASALLFGANPLERKWMDSVRLFMFSIVATAVIAAVCVGYSFVSTLLQDQRKQPTGAAQVQLMPPSTVELHRAAATRGATPTHQRSTTGS